MMLQADSIKIFGQKIIIKPPSKKYMLSILLSIKLSSKTLIRPFSLSAKATQLACAHSYAAKAFLY